MGRNELIKHPKIERLAREIYKGLNVIFRKVVMLAVLMIMIMVMVMMVMFMLVMFMIMFFFMSPLVSDGLSAMAGTRTCTVFENAALL